jgi:hypothetical protein
MPTSPPPSPTYPFSRPRPLSLRPWLLCSCWRLEVAHTQGGQRQPPPHHTVSPDSTAQLNTPRYSISQHSTPQLSTAQHSLAHHISAQYSQASELNTAQYSISQHSTPQLTTAQHSSALLPLARESLSQPIAVSPSPFTPRQVCCSALR